MRAILERWQIKTLQEGWEVPTPICIAGALIVLYLVLTGFMDLIKLIAT